MEVAGSGFGRIPEGCISHVLGLTCPRDACRSAAVASAFLSASDSDTVWDRFLPPDIRSILDRADDTIEYSSKKELFFRLCRPILIDGGKMSFALEKSSGAKCYMLSARNLAIVWGDTPAYWKWLSADTYGHGLSARFAEVASLENVCWLEIRGKVDSRLLTPKTTYTAYLIFKIEEENYGLGNPAQEAWVRLGSHELTQEVRLQPEEMHRAARRRIFGRFFHGIAAGFEPRQETEGGQNRNSDAKVPCSRSDDDWMEIEMGEFFNDEGDDGDVEMCLKEIKGGNWKRGLIIQGIEVRPNKCLLRP